MTIKEIWATIPEELHTDIYGYVGEAINIKSKAFGPPPIEPISFMHLDEKQLALVKWIRDCAYLGKVLDIDLNL